MTNGSSSDTDAPTFDILPLNPDVRRAIDELGWKSPSPVQKEVFEPAIRGRDLVVQARTGTGKTAAFALPLLDTLVRRNTPGVQAVVLCPTRELANQVCTEVETLGKYRGIRAVAVYGGAPMGRQIEELASGAQILVGTPGRVLDHLRRGTLSTSLVKVLVLDESDEMLSMGFLPQISDILSRLPDNRQTLLFSATLPPDVKRIAENRLKDPTFLTLSGDQVGALEIGHVFYQSNGDKLADLLEMLEVEDPESAIIFSNTREQTKRVAAGLQQRGYAAEWLNADLAQNERERVMQATREGQIRFLVATDVAARGIDISHLTHVINYDFPESPEGYVHRTGRTGRAGRTGTAISIIGPSDVGNVYLMRLSYGIRPIEKPLPNSREMRTRSESDVIDSLARVFAERPLDAEAIALARRLLTHQDAEKIVAGLLRDRLSERVQANEDAALARRARVPAALRPAPVSLPSVERREAPVVSVSLPTPGPALVPQASNPASNPVSSPVSSPVSNSAVAPEVGDDGEDRGATEDELRQRRRRRRRDPSHEGPAVPEDDRARGSWHDGSRQRHRGEPLPRVVSEVAVGSSPFAASAPSQGAPLALEPRAEEVIAPDTRSSASTNLTVGALTEEPPKAGGADARALPADAAEIFVSVGRRDGVTEETLQQLLESRGISGDGIAFVRVRFKHSFIGVRRDLLPRGIEALDGTTIAGQRVLAEEARRDRS